MIILRNLMRRRTRTLLTLLGITIGIAAIVALSALAEGLLNNYSNVMSNTGADLSVEAKQEAGAAIQVAVNPVDQRYADELRAMPEVRGVAAMLYTVVPMPGVPYFVLFGHETDQFAIRRFKVTVGEGLGGRTARTQGKPLLLGKVAADSLKKSVGDSVTIYNVTYRVVGLYETGSVMEDGGAVVALEEAQRLANQPRQVSNLAVQLKRPERRDEVLQRLQRRYPELQIVRGGDTSGSAGWLDLIQPFAWAVALIAALVGGVGMMNATLMSVIERTREIGVLRALGWRKRQVMGLILGESLLLSVAGGVTGSALGALLVGVVRRIPAVSGMTQGSLSPALFVQAMVSALVLGTVGGLYPAWHAARLTPIEALSYEGGTHAAASGPTRGGMALRNLFRQRTRTLLTFLGVGIGVLALAAISALSEGMFGEFTRLMITAELTATQANLSDMSLSAIDERVGKQIEAIPEVQYASGGSLAFVTLPEVPLFMLSAYGPLSPQWQSFHLRKGGLTQGPGQLTLGWKAAQAMHKDVGDTLRLLGAHFRVVGIYETGVEFQDAGGAITLRELQKLMGKPRQVMFYEIKVKDPRQVGAVLARLRSEFHGLSIARSAEFAEGMPDMQNMNRMINAILALTLLVGSVVVTNTMVMSVFERTREIGVLRALGWRRRQVLGMVVGEALLLTMGSGLLGLGGAWLLLRGLALIPLLSMLGRLTAFTPLAVGRTLAVCVVLGVLGGVYPAWRASQLLPVEALRYE